MYTPHKSTMLDMEEHSGNLDDRGMFAQPHEYARRGYSSTREVLVAQLLHRFVFFTLGTLCDSPNTRSNCCRKFRG